jgi:hypothetical protein
VAAYNFRERYAPLIESGVKLCTIRKRRKNGWLPMPNDRLRLYVGMRTRNCRLIREVTVRDIVPVTIITQQVPEGGWKADVILATHRLTSPELLAFAKSDGFKDIADFAEFFNRTHGDHLNAYLVRWWPEGQEPRRG